jgi:hypothetical protein
MNPNEGNYTVMLGQLDDNMALFANERSFVLCVCTEDPSLWKPKYYYAEIGDAIRGYVRHKIKSQNNTKGTPEIEKLIESVQALEKRLGDLGENMTKMWYDWLNDPIEQTCRAYNKKVKE